MSSYSKKHGIVRFLFAAVVTHTPCPHCKEQLKTPRAALELGGGVSSLKTAKVWLRMTVLELVAGGAFAL